MILKKRNGQLAVYRSRWIPRGPDVPHGYAVQEYVACIDVGAREIPAALAGKLTEADKQDLERRVCHPARQAWQQAQEAEQRRERDPAWRLVEAHRYVSQAAERSEGMPVRREQVELVQRELARVRVDGTSQPVQGDREKPPDALLQALKAIRLAAQAVREGVYGRAPGTGVRETRTYKLWAELVAAVDGGPSSLLRSLQDKGFAKSRKG